ncbi:DUF6011 domain-containing protein [Nonomuraea sp. NPDC050451]|uniref:DUF6011 domain-containing protein n=1 Tax=Nonomuraea sp. NPDC050451 TaxID=3364364 RepID=UPI0037A09235
MTDALDLPEGFYAIQDPHDPTTVTYWRRKDQAGRGRPQFAAWPPKARNGPVLLKADVPQDLHGAERQQWASRWFHEHLAPYLDAVVEVIAADPVAAGRRFAELTTRCCRCGRALTDDLSKTYGIGPDCRDGIPADLLAAFLTPAVGRAHAELLAGKVAL